MYATGIDRLKAWEDSQAFTGKELAERQRAWIPEEIAEPESWMLEDFADLLPYELA